MTVTTTSFEFAHGRRPRGAGTWAFAFNGNTALEALWWCNGTWGEAKRAALVEARRRGAHSVAVQS